MSETVETVSVSDHVGKAIRLVGSEKKLATACGVTQPAIHKAKKTGRVSAELAIGMHIATNGEVPGSVLRPDLWLDPSHVPTPDRKVAAMEAVAS